VPPSTTRSSPKTDAVLHVQPFPASGRALTVDVEEWYHNCWVGEWIDPATRPPLPREVDRLLAELLELLDLFRLRATFFVLGEVAEEQPRAIRALVAAGHEVASHSFLHRRANDLSPEAFRREIERGKRCLENLTGQAVRGFRAPEWSLRSAENPRLRLVAEVGFAYDSSLSPAWGAGSRANSLSPVRLTWGDGLSLVEFPPLVWGGRLRLPASGWTSRLAPAAWLAGTIARRVEAGELALLTVHPWELVERPAPLPFLGLARLFHDAGRRGFKERLSGWLAAGPWRPLRDFLTVEPEAIPVATASPAPGEAQTLVAATP